MDHTPHSISATDLLPRLGTHRAPRLIDVCVPEAIAEDPWRLPGALHIPHRDVAAWALSQTADVSVVITCHKGLKLSHGAAAHLRSMGFAARALEGGNLAWFTANRPRLALETAPAAGTPWVLAATRAPIALGAAWIIRRWYDPEARLLWVPAEHVDDVAHRFDAHAFPGDAPLATTFASRGLIAPELTSFITSLDENATPATPLLDMLRNLHESDEALVQAALPMLDAAWMAFQSQTAQEAA